MRYENIENLDRVTLEDGLDLYEKKEIFTLINDGKVSGFEKEKKTSDYCTWENM